MMIFCKVNWYFSDEEEEEDDEDLMSVRETMQSLLLREYSTGLFQVFV